MKKSDKIALLKELQMDEPTFYAKFGEPTDLAAQHPELYFKFCMGGRMKHQTGGPQNTLTTMPTIQSGPVQNNYSYDNTNNSVPKINVSTLPNQKPSTINYAQVAGSVAQQAPEYARIWSDGYQGTEQSKGVDTAKTTANAVINATPIGMVSGPVGQVTDVIQGFVDEGNPTTVNPRTGKQEVVRNREEELTNNWTTSTHEQDIEGWTNVISDVFTGDKTATTGDYLGTFMGGKLGHILGDYIDSSNGGTETQKARNAEINKNMNYQDSTASFKYGGKSKFQEGGIPPEMMATMQGGDPTAMQQAPQPPPPYVETWKDITPSMAIDSKLKPIEYKGRTHNYGGIAVTDQSELEHGEYSVLLKDPQTGAPVRYIFSAETGFAKKAKKIMEQYGPQYK